MRWTPHSRRRSSTTTSVRAERCSSSNSFTPRGFDTGVCDRVGDTSVYANRADDAYAAYRVLAEMPEIDARRVFLQGYGNGAIAATMAVDPNVADNHGGGVFAGVVAYYPYCMNDMKVSAPTLIVVGDRDEATPSTLCAGLKDRPNLAVVVVPGATHGFTMPMDRPVEFRGHAMAYDANAAKDAEARADAFIAAHMK